MTERPEEAAHRRYEDMAVNHVLGGLTSEQGRVFRAHLVECTECRARVGELRSIAHDLADVERDERRAVEKRRVETKPVEIAVDDPPEPPRPRRLVPMVVGCLVVIIGLASWLVMLRSANERLIAEVEALELASVVLGTGLRWPARVMDDGPADAQAVVATDGEELVALLVGFDDSPHRAWLLDAEGAVVGDSRLVMPAVRRLVRLGEVPDEARRLVLVRGEAATDGPVGDRVLEASRPSMRP